MDGVGGHAVYCSSYSNAGRLLNAHGFHAGTINKGPRVGTSGDAAKCVRHNMHERYRRITANPQKSPGGCAKISLNRKNMRTRILLALALALVISAQPPPHPRPGEESPED